MELEVLYHGTKFKYVAQHILRTGFKPNIYFSYDLNNAIHMGGKYIFEVVFDKKDLPSNWQVRCLNRIPSSRIARLTMFRVEKASYTNKELLKTVFSNALEFPQGDYCFEDSFDSKTGIIKKKHSRAESFVLNLTNIVLRFLSMSRYHTEMKKWTNHF